MAAFGWIGLTQKFNRWTLAFRDSSAIELFRPCHAHLTGDVCAAVISAKMAVLVLVSTRRAG